MKQTNGNPFELIISFDEAPDLVSRCSSLNAAIIELAGYFVDFGSDSLPAECEVNQFGQVTSMSFNFRGEFYEEVFPQILTTNRLITAKIALLKPKANIEGYPISPSLAHCNRKFAWAAISAGQVVGLMYVSPHVGKDDGEKSKAECYEQLSSKGRVKHGEVRNNRFFVEPHWYTNNKSAARKKANRT